MLSDVIMPRKGGKAACKEIRQMSDTTKIIFVSGYPYSLIENEEELGEYAEVIMKPVMPSELLKKVRELMKAG